MEQNDYIKINELIKKVFETLNEMDQVINKKEISSVSFKASDYTITFKLANNVAKELRKTELKKANLDKSFITTLDRIKTSKLVQKIKNIGTFPYNYVSGKWNNLKLKAHDKIERGKDIIEAFKKGMATFKESTGFAEKQKKNITYLNKSLYEKSFISRMPNEIINKISSILKPISPEISASDKKRLEELKKQKQAFQEAKWQAKSSKLEETITQPEIQLDDINSPEPLLEPNVIDQVKRESIIPEAPVVEPEFLTNAERFRKEQEEKKRALERELEYADRRRFEEARAIKKAMEREALGIESPTHDSSIPIELSEFPSLGR